MTRTPKLTGPPWPTLAQETLLGAALAMDGSTAARFSDWLTMVDFEGRIDESSYRLLPLVWVNLRAAGDDHPLMGRLKGVYRSTWAQAAKRGVLAAGLLESFQAEGIGTLLLKGLPLSLVHYQDAALRPMSDIDIAVHNDKAEEASALLEKHGFRSDGGTAGSDRVVRHAASYLHPAGGEVDLHWHVLFDCPRTAADGHFWKSAVPISVKGVPTLRPCATDLLLHVIVHGVRWNPVPPMRWIVDAAMILRSGEEVDWGRLAEFAGRYRLAGRVGLGLTYLKSRFAMPIPAITLEKLESRSTFLERSELAVMRYEARRPAWRHVRRGMHVVRLLGADEIGKLPVALTRELLNRYVHRPGMR